MLTMRSPRTVSHPVVSQIVDNLRWFVMQAMVNLFLQGVHAALSIAALSALKHRGGKVTIVYLAIIASLVATVVGSINNIIFVVIQLPMALGEGHSDVSALLTRMRIVGDVMRKGSLAISDIIFRVKALLIVCGLGSIAGIIVHGIVYSGTSSLDTLRHAELILPIPLLVTNAVVTVLVSVRLWTYRRDIKIALDQTRGMTKVERVLALLAESGVVYCLIWCIFTFVIVQNAEAPSIAVLTPYEIIAVSYQYIAGIYVALVILILALQRQSEDSTTLSTLNSRGLHFASPPGDGSNTAYERTGSSSMDTDSMPHDGRSILPWWSVQGSASLASQDRGSSLELDEIGGVARVDDKGEGGSGSVPSRAGERVVHEAAT
ncbi:hypothetical protein BD626DRAFT_510511 [Schizophyllum amplum]|uniref:Uncharacterized protein n=1 Tax=Schizophyllum amplum TaxID=97359 RepID=A0A550C1V9_9AGAR|nr:hypothetical protein BD626DRAFT_510511 [Auriculariopsis ampla]